MFLPVARDRANPVAATRRPMPPVSRRQPSGLAHPPRRWYKDRGARIRGVARHPSISLVHRGFIIMQRTIRLLVCVLTVSCAMPATIAWGAFTFLNVPDRRDYAFDGNGLLYVSTGGGSILRYNTQSQS